VSQNSSESASERDQAPSSTRRLNLVEGNAVNPSGKQVKAVKELNREQRVAVTSTDPQILVMAGAGCGKTRVLTHRAGFLLEARGVHPESILALTLTNKAAREMVSRLRWLCGPHAERIHAGTFHSMCARVLRSHPKLVGRTGRFSIYDEDDVQRAIRRLLTKPEAARITPVLVLREISVNKNHAVSLSRYESLAIDDTSRIVARVWREYELELRRGDALDFDDLLLRTVELLKGNPDLCAAYQEKWPSILVDEYQDTNPTQARLLRLLAGRADPQRNLMAVGDDKQVIYGFRLADVRLILGFEEEYPGSTVLTLKRNYRNSPQVLAAANALIAHNLLQRPMTLEADEKIKDGPEVVVHSSTTDTEEARWIAFQIQRAIEQGIPERNIAVLARWGTIVDRVEHALAAAGISYQVIGSRGFFKRKEIRTALAHLRLLCNPRDEAAFARALGIRPKVGTGTIAKIIAYADRNRLTLLEAATAIDLIGGIPSSQARENVRRFAYDMLTFTGQLTARSVSSLACEVIRMPQGVADTLGEDDDAEQRFERLDALGDAARTYERQTDEPTLAGWLADVMLAGRDDLSGREGERGRVTVGTIHAVKGLEWPNVIGAGFEGRVIPSYRANTQEEVEEERRMGYVLMTRAARILVLSYALSREGRHSGPSRFISEALGATGQDSAGQPQPVDATAPAGAAA
jgi:DNA helicase-2/ATP-dependent DNA helicase PcrA